MCHLNSIAKWIKWLMPRNKGGLIAVKDVNRKSCTLEELNCLWNLLQAKYYSSLSIHSSRIVYHLVVSWAVNVLELGSSPCFYQLQVEVSKAPKWLRHLHYICQNWLGYWGVSKYGNTAAECRNSWVSLGAGHSLARAACRSMRVNWFCFLAS